MLTAYVKKLDITGVTDFCNSWCTSPNLFCKSDKKSKKVFDVKLWTWWQLDFVMNLCRLIVTSNCVHYDRINKNGVSKGYEMASQCCNSFWRPGESRGGGVHAVLLYMYIEYDMHELYVDMPRRKETRNGHSTDINYVNEADQSASLA